MYINVILNTEQTICMKILHNNRSFVQLTT